MANLSNPPTIKPEGTREERILMGVTAVEKEILMQRAKKKGLSLTAYLLCCVEADIRRDRRREQREAKKNAPEPQIPGQTDIDDALDALAARNFEPE